MRLPLIAAGLAAMIPTPALADRIVAEGNVARAEGRWGIEAGAGYELDLGVFAVRPMAGALIHTDRDDRFRRGFVGDDQSLCFEVENGGTVNRSNCNATGLRAYGKLEAVARLPLFGEVGVGGRISGDSPRLYGTAAVALLPAVRLKGNIGDRYLALGLLAGF